MKYIFSGILASVLLFACYTNSDDFTPYSEEISTVIGKDLINNITSPTVDTLSVTVKYDSLTGIIDTFETEHGTQIILDSIKVFETGCRSLESNCLNTCGVGQPVKNGEVLILEILEIWKKGDMIRFARPTISEGFPIESGTELLVVLRKKKTGEIVQMQPGQGAKIRIKQIKEAKLVNKMFVYFGDFIEKDSSFNWRRDSIFKNTETPIPISTWKGIKDTATIKGWQFRVNQLRWINCDAPILNDKTKQYVAVSSKFSLPFTHENTVSWLLLDNYNSAISARKGSTKGLFEVNKIPMNEPITLVTISKDNNKYYLGTTKTTSGSTAQTVDIVPIEKTLKEINDFLDTL